MPPTPANSLVTDVPGSAFTTMRGTPEYRLEAEVSEFCEAAFAQAQIQESQSPVAKLYPRIIQYLSGMQWPSRNTAYGTSRPVTNRMLRQYWELVSLLSDGKPEPRIKVLDSSENYSPLQSTLKSLLAYRASKPDYPEARDDIIGFGLLARGVGKVQWNRTLMNGMGDTELVSVKPQNFYKLGGTGYLADAELVIEERIVTLQALHRMYGDVAYLAEPDVFTGAGAMSMNKPPQVSSYQWSRIAPQMQGVIGRAGVGSARAARNESLYPLVRLRHYWMLDSAVNESRERKRVGGEARWGYWVDPGKPLFPRGRVISCAGKRIMRDDCNPYFDGCFHPYLEFMPLRSPWSPDPMSLMANLISPQDIINRIIAGLLETIKASLLPTIITPQGAISRADRDNLSSTISGGMLEYNARLAAGQAPKYREAPQIPTLALQFLNLAMREMDQTSGSAAVDAAAQKEQIPSHDTMEMIQNSRSHLVRVMSRQLETFLNRAGQLTVCRMLQFYSLAHRVAILGEKGVTSLDFVPLYGTLMDSSMAPEDFIRKFEVSIRPGSAMSYDKETRVAMALLLNARGMLSTKNVFRVLDENIDEAENERELQQEALKRLALGALGAMAAGAGKGKEKAASRK